MTASILIDIETSPSSTTLIGAGPISTASNWQFTRRLDRAGQWSFTMPADDPKSTYIRVRRVCRFYQMQEGAVRLELGSGIIESITFTADDQGRRMLQVQGSDFLAELSDRLIGYVPLYEELEEHPTLVFDDSSGSYEDLVFSYDGDVGDTSTSHFTAVDDPLYICHTFPFFKVSFDLDSVNVGTFTTSTWKYYNGSSWVELSGVVDGTVTGGNVAFGQDGDLTFTVPTDWAPYGGSYRIEHTTDQGSADGPEIYDITITRYVPTDRAIDDDAVTPVITLGGTDYYGLMKYAPSGWTLDEVDGYNTTASVTETTTELVLNPGFEDFAGTEDDDTGDNFTSWTEHADTGDGFVEATATHHSGDYAVKINQDAAHLLTIYQDIAVSEDTEYRLTFYAYGDGAHRGYAYVRDNTHSTSLPDMDYCTTLVYGASAAAWAQKTVNFKTPVGCTEVSIWFTGPYIGDDWYWLVDDVTLRKIVRTGEVHMEIRGQSLLEALITVAEHTGQHFIMHPTAKQLRWIGTDNDDSGLRAISANHDFADDDTVCLIVSLEESQNSYELAARVYPYGGGYGDDRVTLEHCTKSVPSGYTLSTYSGGGYIKRDDTETNLGRIERRMDFSEITQIAEGDDYERYASNQLFDRALAWLQDHSATSTDRLTGDVPKAYNIRLAKCAEVLLPGNTIRVQYTEYNADGTKIIDLDDDLYILSSTATAGENGVVTASIEASTVKSHPTGDADWVVRELQKSRQMRPMNI